MTKRQQQPSPLPIMRPEVTSQEIRAIVATLRSSLPIRCDVRIRRVQQANFLAESYLVGRRATIRYVAGMTMLEFVDAMIHEWAHLHSDDFTHGNKWGKSFAAAYRAYHDLNYT